MLASRPSNDPAPPLPAGVRALGWVSLLTDAASDMILPLVPAFLLTLGGGALSLGLIEGVAEAVSAAMKVVAGRLGDRVGLQKPLVLAGYGISALARPLFSIVISPWQAVFVRSADRVGKGLRGPPRDAMLAALARPEARGHAFGFHRMMDNLGGVLGPVLAFLLLQGLALPLRTVFALSIVPGLLSVAVILLFVRNPARDPAGPSVGSAVAPAADSSVDPAADSTADPAKGPSVDSAPATALPLAYRLSAGTRRYLLVFGLFTLAGSGDLFLLRRLSDLGLSVAWAPAAWVSLQLAKGLTNVPGGRAADRFGRKRVLSVAWLLYGLTYAGYAFASSWTIAWVWLAVYALHYGLAEASQRALLTEYVPPHLRGRAFGYQLALEGAVALPANVLFGLAYDHAGAEVAFLAGGLVAVLASAALAWLVPAPPADASGAAR